MVAEELVNIESPFSQLRVRPRRLYTPPLNIKAIDILPVCFNKEQNIWINISYLSQAGLITEGYIFGNGRLSKVELFYNDYGELIDQNSNEDPMSDDLAKLVMGLLEKHKLTDDFCNDVGFPLRFFESLRDSLKGEIDG